MGDNNIRVNHADTNSLNLVCRPYKMELPEIETLGTRTSHIDYHRKKVTGNSIEQKLHITRQDKRLTNNNSRNYSAKFLYMSQKKGDLVLYLLPTVMLTDRRYMITTAKRRCRIPTRLCKNVIFLITVSDLRIQDEYEFQDSTGGGKLRSIVTPTRRVGGDGFKSTTDDDAESSLFATLADCRKMTDDLSQLVIWRADGLDPPSK